MALGIGHCHQPRRACGRLDAMLFGVTFLNGFFSVYLSSVFF